jgi:hypothetical protein
VFSPQGPAPRDDPDAAEGASAMLAADMAMRLRKTHGSSSDFPWLHETCRHSLNGFCFAHDHAGR